MTSVVVLLCILLFMCGLLVLEIQTAVKKVTKVASKKILEDISRLHLFEIQEDETIAPVIEKSHKPDIEPKEAVKIEYLIKGNQFENIIAKQAYLDIKKKYDFDFQEKVNDVIKNIHITTSQDYEIAYSIKQILDFDVLFALHMLGQKEQYEYLEQHFDETQNAYLHTFHKENFDINDFYKEIQYCIRYRKNEIVVYSGKKGLELINCKVMYDDSIAEGIRVCYQDYVYDFSF